MNKLVSIIIPTYQRNDYLKKAIISAKNQTYSRTEILVVDDNSREDLSCEVLNICSEFSVTYLKNNRKKGGCGARNAGIMASRGEYIGFLDDDDVWLPNKLQIQVEVLECNANCVACYCDQYDYYDQKDFFAKPFRAKSLFTHDDLLKGECPISTSIVLVRRSKLFKTNLFDENLQSFQDYDMWLSLTKHGDMVGINQSLSIMRHHLGERTSVNLTKRVAALEAIITKWGGNNDIKFNEFRLKKSFLFSMYYINGIHSDKYLDGLYLKYKAFINTELTTRDFVRMALAMFGNYVFWRLVYFRRAVKNKEVIELLKSIML